ncbi:nucleoside triphosphate pyrophosphohydrolase [Anaerosporobacter faecicola]|uniref:nucleoside triphosphate pyrophosphohydrolase n=1 Tax=Anaerosporobacter faecicola TaxID=2718714 RepID=UPI00143B5138|nr:nucleoside triphosphate pyrophosphohydrolase [Anaerosporobacter faecicola]
MDIELTKKMDSYTKEKKENKTIDCRKDTYCFEDFVDIIRELRSEHGCPWDREQTHESLRNCMLEECYEAIDAINKKDIPNLREELGDVLLQVVLHTVIAEESQEFTMDEVTTEISKKMIHRHPHVFSDVQAEDSATVLRNWEAIKVEEKKEETIEDGMLRVAQALPALIRATKVQKKASKIGVDAPSTESVFNVLNSTLNDMKNAYAIGNQSHIEENFERLLFLVTVLSRKLGINAENSLTNATDKFINRFIGVERLAEGEGKHLKDMSIDEQTALWGRII